jgi:hypothetical protein
VRMTPLASGSFVRSPLSSAARRAIVQASPEDDLSGVDESQQLRCQPRIDRLRIVSQRSKAVISVMIGPLAWRRQWHPKAILAIRLSVE